MEEESGEKTKMTLTATDMKETTSKTKNRELACLYGSQATSTKESTREMREKDLEK